MYSEEALLRPDFDEAAYLRHTLHLPNLDAEQSRLTRCIDAVDSEIRSVITDNANPFIDQLRVGDGAEKAMEEVEASVGALGRSAARLRHTIEEPFVQVQDMILELRHAAEALEVLRQVQRLLGLASKLPDLVKTDLPRAARSLKEIEAILATGAAAGVDAAERQLDTVTKCSAAIRTKAHELLKASMLSHNQSDIAVALQVFYSLGALHRIVATVVGDHKREAIRIIVRELDVQAVTQAAADAGTAGGSSEGSRLREAVFAKLEAVLVDVVQRTASIATVWKVLHKKRDPTTHEPFVAAVEDEAGLLNDYWVALTTQMLEKIAKLQRRGNVQALLVAEFPRFYHLLRNFVGGLGDFFAKDTRREALGTSFLRSAVGELEAQYAQHVADRYREKASVALARIAALMPPLGGESTLVDVAADPARPGVVPAQAAAVDVRPLTRLVAQDVAANRAEPHVVALVLRAATPLVAQLRQRMAECTAKHPLPPLPSVTTSVSAAQLLHVCCANAAATLITELQQGVLGGLHELATDDELSPAVGKLRDLCASLRAAVDAAAAPFAASSAHVLLKCAAQAVERLDDESLLAQLEARARTVQSRFLGLFDRAAPGLDVHARHLAERVLWGTLVRASLLRPWEPRLGPLLERATARVVAAVSVIAPLEQVSPRLRGSLKAFRRLAALPTVDAAALAALHPAVALLHLFQRVPITQLVSLHTLMRKTPDALAEQLDASVAEPSDAACAWIVEFSARALRDYEAKTIADDAESALRAETLAFARVCQDRMLRK